MNGKGQVGFGIAVEASIGAAMFSRMPQLDPEQVGMLHLFPLDASPREPEVVIVEDEVEELMWIALAYLNATGGQRLIGSTVILQATCVDSTIMPLLENRLNYGYGCYGRREATDLGTGEEVLGFPGRQLPAVLANLEALSGKAIGNSRAKKAWKALMSAGV